MPVCRPEHPVFISTAERLVWERLRDSLPQHAHLIANRALSDDQGEYEIDLVVAWPGVGIVNLEVKGGRVRRDPDGRWFTVDARGGEGEIDPVHQVRRNHYAIERFVKRRWSQGNPKFASMVVLPHSEVPADFDGGELPRKRIVDQHELDQLLDRIQVVCKESLHEVASSAYCEAFVKAFVGIRDRQQEFAEQRADRAAMVSSWTESQKRVLDVARALRSFQVVGPAGSGKTFLALEQTRRLASRGFEIALICHSQGLARYLQRVVADWPEREQPAFIGMFEELGTRIWKIKEPAVKDERWYLVESPKAMLEHLRTQPGARLFDGFVVDEAQDITQDKWNVIHRASRLTGEEKILCVFGDTDQQIFPSSALGQLPLPQLIVDENVRNTAPIADVVGLFPRERPKHNHLAGPPVKFIQCRADEAIDAADAEVDRLLEMWSPRDVVLLTTGDRHTVHDERFTQNKESYWAGFWEDGDIFYASVLNFKGLERPVVILALNGFRDPLRAREALYVGLSRPLEQLVVCGDINDIRRVAGDKVADALLACAVDQR
jgi:hypothetical protein